MSTASLSAVRKHVLADESVLRVSFFEGLQPANLLIVLARVRRKFIAKSNPERIAKKNQNVDEKVCDVEIGESGVHYLDTNKSKGTIRQIYPIEDCHTRHHK